MFRAMQRLQKHAQTNAWGELRIKKTSSRQEDEDHGMLVESSMMVLRLSRIPRVVINRGENFIALVHW
jgi:hypothetical protein